MRRTNHYRRYLTRDRIVPLQITNGMLIEFTYKGGTELSDRKPLALILHRDRKFTSIDALNLNYLTDNQIGQVIQLINKQAKIVFTEVKNRYYKRFQIRGVFSPRGIQSDIIYSNLIKPKIINKWDIYRTYKTEKMSNIMIVDYDMKSVTSKLNEDVYPGDGFEVKMKKQRKEQTEQKDNPLMKGDTTSKRKGKKGK